VKDATIPDKAIGLMRVRESGCQLMNYATEDLNTGWPQKWYIFQHHTHSRLCAIQMYALTHSLTNCNANEPSQCFGQLKFFHRSPLNSVYTFQKIRLFSTRHSSRPTLDRVAEPDPNPLTPTPTRPLAVRGVIPQMLRLSQPPNILTSLRLWL